MTAEMMTSVPHPAASLQEQHEWEQALSASNRASTDSHPLPCQRLQLQNSSVPVTSHPAVGATAAECSAWEDALGGTTAALSNSNDSKPDQKHALYAVVECGSHSTRLLLSTGTSDIARLTRDTHLGAILDQTESKASLLPSTQQQQQQQQMPAAASGTLAAVQKYKQLIDQHKQHLAGLAVVATAAIRDAAEGSAIAAAISEVLQCPVRILSGVVRAGSAEWQTLASGAGEPICAFDPNAQRCCLDIKQRKHSTLQRW